MDHLCLFESCVYLVFVSVHCCLVVTYIKGLTYWLLFVVLTVCCVTFPCGIRGQVWYLIVSFPDLCYLSYFHCVSFFLIFHYQKKSLAKGLFFGSQYTLICLWNTIQIAKDHE